MFIYADYLIKLPINFSVNNLNLEKKKILKMWNDSKS